jgi:predicted small metal-binding protein
MHTLSCSDMGNQGCEFLAEGESSAEVKEKMMDHVRATHQELIADLDEEKMTSLNDQMNKLIKGAGVTSNAPQAAE